jgi:hypothetical protein
MTREQLAKLILDTHELHVSDCLAVESLIRALQESHDTNRFAKAQIDAVNRYVDLWQRHASLETQLIVLGEEA